MAGRAGILIAALVLAVPATAAAPATALKPSLLHVVDGVVYAGAKPLVPGAQPSWSPDGSQFAFTRSGGIWLANADGSGTRRLVDGVDPAWSKGGQRIAFVTVDGVLAVLTISGGVQRLTAGTHPSWAPDGRLAYEQDGVVYAGTTPLVQGEDPAFSPDGRSLAFVREGELWRVAADGTGELQLTTGRGDVHDPAWSPAGTRIAFVSAGAIQVIDLATGAIATLARGADADWANVPVARELLPDLDQFAPTSIYVTRRNGHRLLAFQSAVANRGRGPVWIEGRRPRNERLMRVRQLVPRSDGTIHRLPSAGYMRYDVAPTHSHWHFHPFERYELWRTHGTHALRRDHKQGFCFGDRHPLPGARPPHFRAGDCGLFRPTLRSVSEGTSIDYVDIYPPEYHGQWVDVTGLPDGRYVLVHRANPVFALRERSYVNNAASTLLELRGDSVRVLKTCPGSERCRMGP